MGGVRPTTTYAGRPRLGARLCSSPPARGDSCRYLSPTDSRGTLPVPHGANPGWRFVSAAGRYRVRPAAGRVSTRRRGSDRRASLEDGPEDGSPSGPGYAPRARPARSPISKTGRGGLPEDTVRTAAGVAPAFTGSRAAPCRSRPCWHSPAGVNDYEMASLAASQMAAQASLASAAAAAVAALGIWVFGIGMLVQNWRRAKAERHRAEAEKDRHTEAMAALTELIRRTAPPSSQAGPRPAPPSSARAPDRRRCRQSQRRGARTIPAPGPPPPLPGRGWPARPDQRRAD